MQEQRLPDAPTPAWVLMSALPPVLPPVVVVVPELVPELVVEKVVVVVVVEKAGRWRRTCHWRPAWAMRRAVLLERGRQHGGSGSSANLTTTMNTNTNTNTNTDTNTDMDTDMDTSTTLWLHTRTSMMSTVVCGWVSIPRCKRNRGVDQRVYRPWCAQVPLLLLELKSHTAHTVVWCRKQ